MAVLGGGAVSYERGTPVTREVSGHDHDRFGPLPATNAAQISQLHLAQISQLQEKKISQLHLEELREVGALPEAVKVVDDPL